MIKDLGDLGLGAKVFDGPLTVVVLRNTGIKIASGRVMSGLSRDLKRIGLDQSSSLSILNTTSDFIRFGPEIQSRLESRRLR